MSEIQPGTQSTTPRAQDAAAPGAEGPGKRTLVEGQGEEPAAAGPGGGPAAAAGAGAPGKPNAKGGKGGGAPESGPGPRHGLGSHATAIAGARSPRDLRGVPPEVLKRHDLVPRTKGGAAAPGAIQRKGQDGDGGGGGGGDAASIHEAAAHGTSGAGGQLPHLSLIQQAFGKHDVSGVQAHTDGAAASASRAIGAQAYATGTKVAFANNAPSLHTAAHEAAHVVQQAGGVQLAGGVGQAGDHYEQHADQVADAVVRGESAEGLLDGMAGGKSGGGGGAGAVQQQRGAAVQFDVRGTVDQQRNARGVDSPQGGSGGAHGTFIDQGPDDHGPTIRHDHGFLDDGNGGIDETLREDPTWADRLELMKWIAKLEGAELLRPDLVDGTAAYRHFLFGNGADRDIQYGRFISDDSSGQTVLASALEDTRTSALQRHDQDLAGAEPTEGTRTYQIRSNPISVTSGDARYPYPATENWQKAIGAHSIWIEAAVTVTVTRVRDAGSEPLPGGVREPGTGSSTEAGPPTFSRHFSIEMTIHAEDRYNFNPNNVDIATGTPDSANGRFEITGLGHEYMNRGTFSQSFEFDANMEPAASPGSSASPNDPGRSSRSGRPADRRAYPTTR